MYVIKRPTCRDSQVAIHLLLSTQEAVCANIMVVMLQHCGILLLQQQSLIRKVQGASKAAPAASQQQQAGKAHPHHQ
jgi:hypothetical protein